MTGNESSKLSRRRGQTLERALLEAAWTELVEQGYPAFTLEAVAHRAGTSRPVLYRRWKMRSELAVAAIGWYVSEHPIEVLDMGSVRQEMAVLMRQLSERATPAPVKLFLALRDELCGAGTSFSDVRGSLIGHSGEADLVSLVLARGVKRGEIDPCKLSPRVISLPTDLARHEILMTMEPLSDQAIVEILDLIFLPLVMLS